MENDNEDQSDIENIKANIDNEIINRLKKLLESSDPKELGTESVGKEQMFDEPIKAFGSHGKEIVVNVKAYIYETNEKGETVAPYSVTSNDFYIPLDAKTENADLIIETFMSKLIECMSQRAKEIVNNA